LAPTPPESAVRAWTEAFRQAVASPGYAALRERHGLHPFEPLTGAALEDFVRLRIEDYQRLAGELGLRRWSR
jgi:putative tricarboxylic transport membrane protein